MDSWPCGASSDAMGTGRSVCRRAASTGQQRMVTFSLQHSGQPVRVIDMRGVSGLRFQHLML